MEKNNRRINFERSWFSHRPKSLFIAIEFREQSFPVYVRYIRTGDMPARKGVKTPVDATSSAVNTPHRIRIAGQVINGPSHGDSKTLGN